MTPDRHDENPDDGTEHAVLADVGSIDAAGISILGTGTAQVRVVLPAADDDDLAADDDVVMDEVHVDDVYADSPAITPEPAEEARIDEVATGDIILEDVPVDARGASAEIEAALLDAIHDAVEVEELEGDADEPAAALAHEESDADIPVSAEIAVTAAADAPAAEPAPEPAAPAEPETPAAATVATTAPAAGSVPIGDPIPVTGTIPATRRAAHHGADGNRADRAHAVERVQTPQPEVVLTAKRLGDLQDAGESADLLTADRLLDRGQLSGAEPEGLWRQLVYSLSRHRINLGDSKKAQARKALDRRIAAPLPGGARFVPVLSRKGGVGKTTVTTLLGMALADARDDRVIAVDANPDRGTLADRIGRPSGRTVRDLARTRGDVSGFNDISTIVARDETRLDVLASDADPRVSEAFSDRDYHDVASLAAHYYSIVLTDTGTGIVHSVMGATLELADQLVIVAGLSIDEARLASETLTWLETNGYAAQVRGAIVVLNNARPGTPLVRESELESHFRSRVRAVIRVPYDPLIGTGSAITFRDLQPATRQSARELAAAVVEGLRAVAPAA